MPTVTVAAAGETATATYPAWRLVWADEFDGATVDPGKWNVRDGTFLSYDQAYILARNVTVAGGILHITARRETAGGRPFTTGYLDTIGKFGQQFGRWEMRAKLPTVPGQSLGIWPAFWLRPAAAGFDGEIDIMEAWGEPSPRVGYRSGSAQWTVHASEAAGHAKTSNWLTPATSAALLPLSAAFHVYALEWDQAGMRFYVDNYLAGAPTVAKFPWLTSSFAGPMSIRLNLQVGQNYWGNPDPAHPELTVTPADFLIDYIRVYAPLKGA